MTRKIIYIFMLITASFILGFRSCEPDMAADEALRLNAEQDTVRRKMEENFNAEYLFEDRLMVYGEKAKQKVIDLAEYLSLCSDRSMDTLLKQRVIEMISRLFYRQDVHTQYQGTKNDIFARLPMHLTKLDGRAAITDYESLVYEVSELRTIDPLHKDTDQTYSGRLGCRIRISGITQHDTLMLQESLNIVYIRLLRTDKPFGAEASMRVWQVFLEKIEKQH